MKEQSITQKLSWLHTWSGLIFGWLLFAIFLTGTLAVFDREITHWMQPEIQARPGSQADAAQRGLDWLTVHKPEAAQWNIGLPTERSPGLRVSAGEGRRGAGQVLDAQTGEAVAVRETAGGNFFFRFHFTLNLPRSLGVWVVGLAAMAMLAALISGIVIHKKFFKEFFTFRPAKGQRSWLDAHNASAVLVLPFHLMITYTGLVIFYFIYMPAGVDALYGGDFKALQRDIRPGMVQEDRGGQGQRQPGQQHQGPQPEIGDVQRQDSGQVQRDGRGTGQRPEPPAAPVSNQPMLPLSLFIAEGERHFGAGNVSSLSISQPGREGSTVSVGRLLGSRVALTKGDSLVMDAYAGRVLRAPSENRPSVLTQRVMAGLHFAQFGGYPMRWLYFLCGLASCAMIATGLVLFTVKRRRKYAVEGPAGRALYRVVEALNVSSVAGLGCACAALFWGNRLLPVGLDARAGAEIQLFFGVWLAALVHGLVRPRMRAWVEQLGLGAVLCLLLPVLDLYTAPGTPRAALQAGDSMRFGVDAGCLLLGLVLMLMAWKVARRTAEPLPHKAAGRLASGSSLEAAR